jgi:DNA-binding transcriptional LysR family regulator
MLLLLRSIEYRTQSSINIIIFSDGYDLLYQVPTAEIAAMQKLRYGGLEVEVGMELYQIRAFAAVAELGHLTRAAERLHVSQPALSGQIKALESRLDLKLFERAPGGMVLTSAGRRLLPRAIEVLDAAEEFRRSASRLSGKVAGVLRVGTVNDPESVRLGRLLSAALRLHPGLELAVSREVSGEALEGVRSGRLDASYYFGELPGDDIASIELRKIAYRIAVPAAWAHHVEGAEWATIASVPWVLTPKISTYHALVTRLFDEQGLALPSRFVEADDESVIVNLVVSGVGASLLREEVALELEAAGTARIWGATRIVSTLWFTALAARRDDPMVKAAFDLVRESWRAPEVDRAVALA